MKLRAPLSHTAASGSWDMDGGMTSTIDVLVAGFHLAARLETEASTGSYAAPPPSAPASSRTIGVALSVPATLWSFLDELTIARPSLRTTVNRWMTGVCG
jgi:hypothetical protein